MTVSKLVYIFTMGEEKGSKANAYKKTQLMPRVLVLYNKGYSCRVIGDELGVSPRSVSKWLKEEGLPIRRAGGNVENRRKKQPSEDQKIKNVDPMGAALRDGLADALDAAEAQTAEGRDKNLLNHYEGAVDFYEAREKEAGQIFEVASKQNTPQEKYQMYVAQMGLRLLRDSFPEIKPPRTVKELKELDEIIRRSMGLGGRGQGSAGTGLAIDINILNNPKASRGAVVEGKENVDVIRVAKDRGIIDAEFSEEEEERKIKIEEAEAAVRKLEAELKAKEDGVDQNEAE